MKTLSNIDSYFCNILKNKDVFARFALYSFILQQKMQQLSVNSVQSNVNLLTDVYEQLKKRKNELCKKINSVKKYVMFV